MKHVPKTVTASANGIKIFYDEKKKPHWINYEPSTLNNVQLYGNTLNGNSYQVFEDDTFSPTQQRLYRQVLFGMDMVPLEVAKEMTEKQKRNIYITQRRAKRVLNSWKNQIVASFVDSLFKEVFWNSEFTKEMEAFTDSQEEFNDENTLSFSELGINREQIAGKLIEHGFLPKNFFQLAA